MGKFCTGCGAKLSDEAKFCTVCGTKSSSVPKKDEVTSNNTVMSKTVEQVKTESKNYVKGVLSNMTPALKSTGEFALPMESISFTDDIPIAGLIPLLKSGFKGLVSGFKRTFTDKKRLVVVIILAFVWLAVNILTALNIFPLPVRLLSLLTAARGSLIGGSIGKGLVAALFSQLIADSGMLKSLKSGFGQFSKIGKGGVKEFSKLLLGAGFALVVCNLMVSSNIQNIMVCISAFLLSIKALANNGFLRRIIAALIPKAGGGSVTKIMSGWTLGFAVFVAVSFLPGGKNGYLIGALLLIIGGVLTVIAKKEVSAR